MIDKQTYTFDHIERVSKNNKKADKILIEKVIRALTLLTDLRKENLDFIFKGGTALMLMLDKNNRLSIDIDIIVPPDTDIPDKVLSNIILQGSFLRYEEQKRNVQSYIKKAHYKFFYNPIHKTHSNEEYILLDVLFENNPYNTLTETSVNSAFLKLNKEPLKVTTPTLNNILGDKLTAFAPNTTGIPYFKSKHSMSMEIIKQLYDIGNLFDACTDVSEVGLVFTKIVQTELKYRSISTLTIDDVLKDIFETSLCISLRGKGGNCMFEEIQKGIQRIKPYIISELFHIDKVIVSSSKTAYLSALIKNKKNNFIKFTGSSQITDFEIINQNYNRLNKLKKINPEAFFYWYKALELRNEV